MKMIYTLALLLSQIAFAQLSNSIITVSNATVGQGESFEITVSTTELLSGWNVIAFQFKLSYDSTLIAYNSYSIAGTLSQGGSVFVNDTKKNEISLSYMVSALPLTGVGDLIKLQFTSLSNNSGTTALALSNFYYNNTPITNLNDGSVTVNPNEIELNTKLFLEGAYR